MTDQDTAAEDAEARERRSIYLCSIGATTGVDGVLAREIILLQDRIEALERSLHDRR